MFHLNTAANVFSTNWFKKDNCALCKAGTMTEGVLLKGTSKNKIL